MKSAVYFIDLRATTGKSFVEKLGKLVDVAGLSDTIKKETWSQLSSISANWGIPHLSGRYLSAKSWTP